MRTTLHKACFCKLKLARAIRTDSDNWISDYLEEDQNHKHFILTVFLLLTQCLVRYVPHHGINITLLRLTTELIWLFTVFDTQDLYKFQTVRLVFNQ